MTNRLPPDIDRMLWEIAESQDSNAYDDFEKRFPQLVGELGKRIQLVRELRDARGSGQARPVPQFDRRAPARVGLQPKALLALCTATVACIGLGAYVVTGRIMNHPQIIRPKTVPLDPPSFVAAPEVPAPKSHEALPVPQVPDRTPQSPPVAAYLKPQDVRMERTKLQLAILAVATSGKLDVEFAPNMPNPEIRMEYRNMNAIDILKDLGPRFGFT